MRYGITFALVHRFALEAERARQRKSIAAAACSYCRAAMTVTVVGSGVGMSEFLFEVRFPAFVGGSFSCRSRSQG
jgi:hypothetical protein